MNAARFSPRNMSRFLRLLSAEIGRDTYYAVLSKSELSNDWRSPEFFLPLDDTEAAEAYARLQSALRTYYGRGARGILMRIGTKLWEPMLNESSLAIKTRAALVRRLPKAMRRKSALDLLAALFGAGRGSITVHTLDLDLLLVDRTSPATLGQTDDTPICYVTLGLIRECLFWATGEEHDIEELACRATGAHQCEFKITIGAA